MSLKEFTVVISREGSETLEEISNGQSEVLLIPKRDEVRRYLDEKGIKVICGVLIPRALSELEENITLLPF